MWTRRICPALLFLGSLILYLLTMAPTVTFVDSGELIVTARNLGVAHPPGFPLYTLISHLATLLPFGNVAQRVHFISALCGALTVLVVYWLTIEILASVRMRSSQPAGKRSELVAEKYVFIPGMVSSLLAAFSRTLWAYATVAEVYTLNAFLILLTLLLMLRWRNRILVRKESDAEAGRTQQKRRKSQETAPAPKKSLAEDRLLYAAAFLFGLALGVHHVTVALMLPAFAWLVYATEGMQFFKSRRLALAALAGLAGACIYAYLPWAAARGAVLTWGRPDTLGRFWSHITGRQYQSNIAFAADQTGRELALFGKILFREFGWPWIPASLAFAVCGLVSFFRKDKVLLAAFGLVIGCNLILGLGYEISEDKDAYYLPVLLLMAIGAGQGVYTMIGSARLRGLRIAAGAGILVLAVAFSCNLGFNNRHGFFVAKDYINNIFKTIAPNGMLITEDWQVASPMLYFQEIERQRPDVICIDTLLLRRSWYVGYLQSRYPEMMERSRGSVQDFLEYLLRWEKDPDSFERDPVLVQRIESRYDALIDSVIQNQKAPVYATQDVVLSPDPGGQALAKALLAKYQIVPAGLIFRMFADRVPHPPELPELETRGLADGPPSIREDSVVRQKVIQVYVTMLVNCGRAFAAQKDEVRAMDAYRRAWAIDSGMVLERNLLPPGLSF
jgi:hypothetical protein